jgi:hypothetical protein
MPKEWGGLELDFGPNAFRNTVLFLWHFGQRKPNFVKGIVIEPLMSVRHLNRVQIQPVYFSKVNLDKSLTLSEASYLWNVGNRMWLWGLRRRLLHKTTFPGSRWWWLWEKASEINFFPINSGWTNSPVSFCKTLFVLLAKQILFSLGHVFPKASCFYVNCVWIANRQFD